ncbi:DUF4013 domain-containing protein [Haloarchaeobius sp. DYHT-AS-18]|uniref:DUF4013 domain-containing protein n=1 Tax=Haloarchaeobius sp. DYHT-AS-18 TaxID=3446117 RepID=UPI003EBE1829
MLGESLKFPLQGEESTKTVAIGGLLNLVALFIPIIPQLFIYGYALRAMRAGLNGDRTAPTFSDWEGLLKEGALVFGVMLIYVGIPIFLFAIIVPIFGGFAIGLGGEAGGSAGAGAGSMVLIALLGVGFLVTFLAYYMVPAALVGLAARGEFGAAFDLQSVKRLAFNGTYFVGVVVSFFVLLIGSILSLPLYIILVGFAIQFILIAGVFNYLGRIARKAAPGTQSQPAEGRPQTSL